MHIFNQFEWNREFLKFYVKVWCFLFHISFILSFLLRYNWQFQFLKFYSTFVWICLWNNCVTCVYTNNELIYFHKMNLFSLTFLFYLSLFTDTYSILILRYLSGISVSIKVKGMWFSCHGTSVWWNKRW